MATLQISISGDAPASVALAALFDAVSGQPIQPAEGLPLPLTCAGNGLWQCSFTDVAPTIYRCVCRISWGDGSTTDIEALTRGAAAPAGRYAAQADIEAVFGRQNVALWADLDNLGDPVASAARIAAALAYADDTIDGCFRGGPYAVPLALASGQATVTHWAAVVAGVWLYSNRGQRDDEAHSGRYMEMLAAATAEMRQCRTGQSRRLDAAPAGAAATPAPQVTGGGSRPRPFLMGDIWGNVR